MRRARRFRAESHRQRCHRCGNADKLDFHVPDGIWSDAVPSKLRNGVLCLACFDDLAFAAGVRYAHHLTTLWFAGDQAVLELAVVRARDL
jgi:hypothetical protein